MSIAQSHIQPFIGNYIKFIFAKGCCLILLVFFFSATVFHGTVHAEIQENSPSSSWETRYFEETSITIELGVTNILSGIHSFQDLREAVNTWYRGWEKIKKDSLFEVNKTQSIDSYGYVYSLYVMCKTLELASADAHKAAQNDLSNEILRRASWITAESKRLANAIAQVIIMHSDNRYYSRRIEIMRSKLHEIEINYNKYVDRKIFSIDNAQ